MKLGEFGVGKITKQNATKDAPIGSEYSNVKKLGLGSGKPKLHDKKATKNSDPNTLFNLGIGENEVQELRIEKPDPKDTLGVKRKEMPQVKSDDYAEFVAYLQKNGAKFTKETIPARDLKAMQKEFSDEGIMKQLMKNIKQGPNRKAVIASSDDYIMDGHHRWLVAINTGADLNVFRVNLPAYELYDLVNKFEKTYYKDIYSERVSIGVPFASGLVMKLFPHRPLKIKKSTPGKLKYEDVGLTHTLELGTYKHNEENITVRVNPDKSVSFIEPQEYSIADDQEYLEYAQSLLADANNWTKVANEAITTVDLNQLETFADKLFAKVGIDVEFTRHFLDRVNDSRNVKPITMAELTRLFKQEFKRYGKPIAQMGPNQEAVMKDLQTDINLPFALQYDKDNNELDLIAKTVMRKKDFKTSNREFPVEGWSAKYKKSINCSNPKGFSQKAHCAGKKKNEDDDSKETLGSLINFPGYDKKEKKPKYKPVPKKEKGMLDKIKSWFTDDINEAYKLRLENDDDLLVLHIRNTRTGERAEVRGNPNYEIDYDENDELHQLLDVIGKASNISELMNGKIVSVNPKHPDGPKSYAALEKAMNESIRESYEIEFVCVNPNFCDATEQKNQDRLFQALRAVPGIIVYKQDFDEHNSMAAIIKDEEDTDAPKLIQKIAQQYKVAIDLENDVSQSMMDDIITGRLEGLTDYYDTDSLSEAKVDEGVNDPHIFKAVFLAGGPGRGKSFVAKNILGGTGLRSINSDEVYEFLMKKQGLSLDPETIFSPQGQEFRDKAKGLSRRREATYLDGRLGLIIDGTGKDVARYRGIEQKLKAIGYDTSMIYVNTSLEVAQQRNKQRERSIPAAAVEEMWNYVQQNLMQFQQMFGAGRFHIIDNSGGLEDLDRQKNFDKVYVETQRFLNTPPKNRKALAWIQKQKEQNDGQRSAEQPTTNQEPDGGTTASN